MTWKRNIGGKISRIAFSRVLLKYNNDANETLDSKRKHRKTFPGFKYEKRFSLRTQSYRNVNCTTIARQYSQRKEKTGEGDKKKLARKPKVSFREMKIILNFRGTVCWSYFWCRITTHHSVVAPTAEIYFAYFFQIRLFLFGITRVTKRSIFIHSLIMISTLLNFVINISILFDAQRFPVSFFSLFFFLNFVV